MEYSTYQAQIHPCSHPNPKDRHILNPSKNLGRIIHMQRDLSYRHVAYIDIGGCSHCIPWPHLDQRPGGKDPGINGRMLGGEEFLWLSSAILLPFGPSTNHRILWRSLAVV